MIKIDHLSVGYGKQLILNDLNLIIPENSITAVIGPNGCGKSTLLKSFFHLADISTGDIYLNNTPISKMTTKELAQKMSYLSQHHSHPALCVERMVLHGRFAHLSSPRSYRKEDYMICEKSMEQAGILHLRNKNVSSLSGGEIQKVFLAMAYAGDAEILLFDEPTTYLDISCQLELLHAMFKLRSEGKTIVTVLHDLNYALKISDCLVVMNDGKIITSGTPDEIFQSNTLDEVFQISIHKVQDASGNVHYVTGL